MIARYGTNHIGVNGLSTPTLFGRCGVDEKRNQVGQYASQVSDSRSIARYAGPNINHMGVHIVSSEGFGVDRRWKPQWSIYVARIR